MNAYYLLLTQIVVSVSVSVAALCVISGPLRRVLFRMCPGDEAVDFWLGYTKLMLLIAPLVCVLLVSAFPHHDTLFSSFRLSFITALIGLLIGLYSIGKRLSAFAASAKKSGDAA